MRYGIDEGFEFLVYCLKFGDLSFKIFTRRKCFASFFRLIAVGNVAFSGGNRFYLHPGFVPHGRRGQPDVQDAAVLSLAPGFKGKDGFSGEQPADQVQVFGHLLRRRQVADGHLQGLGLAPPVHLLRTPVPGYYVAVQIKQEDRIIGIRQNRGQTTGLPLGPHHSSYVVEGDNHPVNLILLREIRQDAHQVARPIGMHYFPFDNVSSLYDNPGIGNQVEIDEIYRQVADRAAGVRRNKFQDPRDRRWKKFDSQVAVQKKGGDLGGF